MEPWREDALQGTQNKDLSFILKQCQFVFFGKSYQIKWINNPSMTSSLANLRLHDVLPVEDSKVHVWMLLCEAGLEFRGLQFLVRCTLLKGLPDLNTFICYFAFIILVSLPFVWSLMRLVDH